jgi:hypothetical protein
MGKSPHTFKPREWTFLLAVLDQKISGDDWDGELRMNQDKALACLFNQEFPKLKLNDSQVSRKLTKLCSEYGKEGAKKFDIFKKGSRCLDIEKFNTDDCQLFCQARKRLGLPEVELACKEPETVSILSGRLQDV